jgi:hypothetical protein
MSKYALLLSSAWGVAVAERTSVKAVESIFPSPMFSVFPAKRTKHTVQAHVGCRKWDKDYFGVGVAVEKKMRVTVCYTPNGEKVRREEGVGGATDSYGQLRTATDS